MSEPRIISPLLDGFSLGSSMSSHGGVNCYPAMRADSDEKYIVKTISIPASQTRLEALLLTGAYPNAEAARSYFQELTQGIVNESEILNKLSQRGGFLPFLGSQIKPLDEGVGFEVYLLSYYRRSLERFLRRSPMTHLSAVNMGIDLCSALSACREAGYLYVDLKPSNVFLTGEQGYHIGDLGFVSLDSLKYTSLPDRCRSDWTPPEISDAFATLNTTMDTYALGLILYQVYNNGTLPFDSAESRKILTPESAAGEPLPAPAYADYEMAQIILKACACDPAERWQDPNEMGRALIAYMQRNGANDVPIGPPVVSDAPIIDIPTGSDESDADAAAEPGDMIEDTEDTAAQEDTATSEDTKEPESDWIDRMDAILSEDSAPGDESDEDAISLRELLTGDQTVPVADEGEEADAGELSEETADMLNQANDLITHEIPEPAVAPDPIDVPIPEPIILPDDEDEEDTPAEEAQEEPEDASDDASDDGEEVREEVSDEDESDEILVSATYTDKPKRGKKLIGWLIALLIIGLIGCGAFYAYNEYYLQEVTSLTVDGEGDEMTVSVVSEIDQNLLTVVCVDQYGKKFSSPLENGSAFFTGLDPDTQYNITLEVDGFHKLTGQTSAQYYTLPQVTVTAFSSVTGPEDGSVILSFTTEGPAIENWTVQYGAAGEASTSIAFSGSTITVSGLTPGAEYEFSLVAGDEVQLIGQTSIFHTASAVIYGEDLLVIGNSDGSMTASWNAPEGISVESWSARCYNETGYDQSFEVSEPTATFTDIDSTASYTVEITAAGMTQSARIYVTANPINITSVTPSSISSDSLAVTWEYQGNAPDGGWLLLYTVDQGTEQHVIQCPDAIAVVEPVAPGSHYDLTVQAASAVTVFGGTGSIDIAEAGEFNNYGLSAADIEMTLCLAPEEDGWNHYDVDEEDNTTSFTADQSAGIILHTTDTYNVEYNNVTATYVVRDSEDKLACISTSTQTWESMWSQGYCELEIPTLPANPGSYTLELYFDGALVATEGITIE